MQILRSLLLVALVACSSAGCDAIKNLRAAFHGDEGPMGPATPEGAGLSVTVDPPTGISILIDGIKVANQSPYVSATLDPGPHTLHVRGMGYLPVTLPVFLKTRELLKVPVALRARPMPRGAAQEPPEPPPPREPQRGAPIPPPAPPQDLPPGMAPLDVHWIAQPANAVLLDGLRLDGKTLRIHRQNGVLQVGGITLPYLVTPSRVLDLTVPNDDGDYTRDGAPLAAGTVIHLTHGATRIRRAGHDASEQSVILKRLN